MTDVQEAPHKVTHYPILKPNSGSGHQVVLEPSPRRVRVVFNGETIAQSRNAMLMHESNHIPLYYFPVEDVRMDLLEKTDHSSHCPFKGDASTSSGCSAGILSCSVSAKCSPLQILPTVPFAPDREQLSSVAGRP